MGDKRKTRTEPGQDQEEEGKDAPNAKRSKRAFQQYLILYAMQGISPKPKTTSNLSIVLLENEQQGDNVELNIFPNVIDCRNSTNQYSGTTE